jgi:hypothetical protein
LSKIDAEMIGSPLTIIDHEWAKAAKPRRGTRLQTHARATTGAPDWESAAVGVIATVSMVGCKALS